MGIGGGSRDVSSTEERIHYIRTKDKRYSTHAYRFTLDFLDYLEENDLGDKKEQRNDLTSVECFMKHLPTYLERQFGPMRDLVLERWGLQKPKDMGNILENMAEYGLTRWGKGEQAEDFETYTKWPNR